jgi:hypothetical protein
VGVSFNIDTVIDLEYAIANFALKLYFILKNVLLVYMLHHALFVHISMAAADAYAFWVYNSLFTNSALLPNTVRDRHGIELCALGLQKGQTY